MRLLGRGVVDSRARPGTSVTIQIADREFGPLIAGPSGSVRIPIVASPGIESATRLTIDSAGEEESEDVDLGVPPFLRLLAVCPTSGNDMLVFGVDAHGAPLREAALTLRASVGAMTAPRMIAPGVYTSSLAAPPEAQSGTAARLSATLAGGSELSARCETHVMGGPPAQLALALEPKVYVAGSGTPIDVRMRVLDAAGRPARHGQVELTVDAGDVSEVTVLGDGRYSAAWGPPDRFHDNRVAHVQVRAGVGAATVKAEANLALRPGRVANVVVTAAERELLADGSTGMQLLVEATDKHGNRVLDPTLRGAADGSIGDLADSNGDGVLEATYTAPVRYEPTTDTITVRDGTTDAAGRVALGLRPSRRSLSLGAKLGYSTNLGAFSAPIFLGELRLKLPLFEQAPALGLEVGYLGRSVERHPAERADTVQALIHAVPVVARASYRLALTPALDLHVGAGGGVYVVRSQDGIATTGANSTDLCVRNNLIAHNSGWTLNAAKAVTFEQTNCPAPLRAGPRYGNATFQNTSGECGGGSCAACGCLPPGSFLEYAVDPLLDASYCLGEPSLVDAAADLGYDLNGGAAGLYAGSAPDVGAQETAPDCH